VKTQHYQEGDILIIAPQGRLDTMHAPELLKLIEQLLSNRPRGCLLDLREVTFLSSSGLQAILASAKISNTNQINFGVFGMQDMTYDVFTMSGFNKFIQSFSSKEDALANLL